MKILFVAFYFPPFNTIGAVRAGKTAKYLREIGHDIRVLTAGNQPLQATLPLEVPDNLVKYTNWFDVNKPLYPLVGGYDRVTKVGLSNSAKSPIASYLGGAYRNIFNIPDGQIGWLRSGLAEAKLIMQSWRPDIIFASGLPASTLLLAREISKYSGLPWIAELRDPWIGNPYRPIPAWRLPLEKALERRTLSSCTGIVTTTEKLTSDLASTYHKPTITIYNGYDLDDYPEEVANRPPGHTRTSELNLVHTGSIYQGKRDPTPLFQALKILRKWGQFRMNFYGRGLEPIRQISRQLNLEDIVYTFDEVAYTESLLIQRRADALILLLGNGEDEDVFIPGKFFEYVGARRPILAINGRRTTSAQLIEKHHLGHHSDDPVRIASVLRGWMATKLSTGHLPDLPLTDVQQFSRSAQISKLSRFLEALSTQ